MTGSLTHSPAYVIRQLLVDESLATIRTTTWPAFVSSMPDGPRVPDNAICLYNTTARGHGRALTDGEQQGHEGIQVLVRASNYDDGRTKTQAVKEKFDTGVYRQLVVVGSSTYHVQSVSCVGSIIDLGNESPESKRLLFSLNATVSLQQVA